MRRLFWFIALGAFVACGESLQDDSVDAPDRSRDDGGDAAGDANAGANDGGAASDVAVDGDGDANADGTTACTPRVRCADDASVCSLERQCVPLIGVGQACDASYQCANKRCDPDGGTCTDSTAIFSCKAQDDLCFGNECCAGTFCNGIGSQGICQLCQLKGESCVLATCCSGVCNASGVCE